MRPVSELGFLSLAAGALFTCMRLNKREAGGAKPRWETQLFLASRRPCGTLVKAQRCGTRREGMGRNWRGKGIAGLACRTQGIFDWSSLFFFGLFTFSLN